MHLMLFSDRSEPVEQALRAYVARVATGLGLGPESWFCELSDVRGAYVALARRLPSVPDRDVALLWDDHAGWSLATETGSPGDLKVMARLGEDPAPPPETVVTFVDDLFNGRRTVPDPARASARGRVGSAAGPASAGSGRVPVVPVPDPAAPVVRSDADVP